MSFIKLGEIVEISRIENSDSCIPAVTQDVLDNFKKIAGDLKKIAPKAEDFLYFSAVMMHAAEASALNDDGSNRLTTLGEEVKVGWDKRGGTWRWTSNDPSIKPYKNSNGDIFPEEELVKAYKKWVHKPLCIDHKSSSVDHVRGFIVDTYYDRNLKRVIALCALDKHNYPDLARKVATGYSNCVSMGTAVGRAICSDCATVARTENDFCDHMRRKSCYGEINIDLNPLELSIVVNGADPRASIKHIIAAANTMNSYLDNRSKQLEKLAEGEYFATLIRGQTSDNSGVNDSISVRVKGTDLDSFKNDIERGLRELQSYNEKFSEKDTNDLVSNQTSSTVAMDETLLPNTDSGLSPPHARYATDASSIKELHEVTAAIEFKLNQMKKSLNKLASLKNIQEETMSVNRMNKEAYYQGTEEPTPGQAKYPKDPMNEKLRTDGDKHMEGQNPFPDTGPVDGMHPGVESAGMGELERKKMLARAEAEERAMRRIAIVNLAKQALENKKAYFNNGEGPNNPNTPTPGKPKYPVDKTQYDLRDDDDKHMVGQKPFPGVGSVDGLHPSPESADISDEKKRKEMLSRAALKATFIKAANHDGTTDLGRSSWNVFLGDRLLLTASVNELSGNRSEILYDSIATREFGTKLIEKIKAQGADKVKSLMKLGQDAGAPVPPVAAPPEASTPPDAPLSTPEESTPSETTSGDPKQTALDLAEKARDVTSDLLEAVRTLAGEDKEMGDVEGVTPEMGAVASNEYSTASLNAFRKELNGTLSHAMKEAVAGLNDHEQELDMIANMYDKGTVTTANKELVGSIVEDAFNEAKTAIADGFRLMTAFVKYARGTEAIVKRAELEEELASLTEPEPKGDMMESLDVDGDDLMSLVQDTDNEVDEVQSMLDDSDETVVSPDDLTGEPSLDPENPEALDLDSVDDNNIMAKPEELKNLEVKPGTKVEVTASFNSKEGRATLRAKLAADALGKYDDGQVQDMSKAKFSDMLDEADRLTDGQTKLDVKPSDNLGYVETLPEVNKAMMDLAKAPPKVRKEAEAIHKLVSEGKLAASDLDALVAEGLDKDAVAYYKKYYSQVEGGGEFAGELVKEHVKAQLEEEINKYKVKISRAYELAHDMVDRGLCHGDRSSVSAQVEEIMQFNDESFDSLKRVVARHSLVLRKEAGRMPQVGMIGSGEVGPTHVSENDLFSQLSVAFSKTPRRNF